MVNLLQTPLICKLNLNKLDICKRFATATLVPEHSKNSRPKSNKFVTLDSKFSLLERSNHDGSVGEALVSHEGVRGSIVVFRLCKGPRPTVVEHPHIMDRSPIPVAGETKLAPATKVVFSRLQ